MSKPMFDVLSLPDSVICNALCSYLSLKDLARLDSAYCHHHNRATLYELFHLKQFVLSSQVNLSNAIHLKWLKTKDMKVSSAVVRGTLHKARQYLKAHGSFIQTLSLEEETSAVAMAAIATYCENLTGLRVEECTLTQYFRAILCNNPNIADLRCQRVDCEEGILTDLSLNKLQVYCIDECGHLPGFPWSSTTYSSSLHTVRWDCVEYPPECLTAIATNCPQLKTLSCDFVDLQHSLLKVLAPKLSGLFNLSIHCNHTVTDEEVRCLVRNISSLRILNIQCCSSLTNLSISHVAEHAGHTLEVLWTSIHDPTAEATEHILDNFAQKCTNLKHLHIDTGDHTLCSGKGTSLLMRGCPDLRTLFINQESTICASSRGFIAAMRPNVKVMVEDDNDYDVLSFPVM